MQPGGPDHRDLHHRDVEHRHLRGALEFSARFADEGRRQRPPIPSPPAFRSVLGRSRVPTGALGKLRRAVDGDHEFRALVARAATPDLVDPIGLLWLTRPDGWEQQLVELVDAAERAEHEHEVEAELHRERKRREAAEVRATRERTRAVGLETTVEALGTEVDELRAEVDELSEERSELRAELIEARNDARHADDRAAAAAAKLRELEAARHDAASRADQAEDTRDQVLAARVETEVELGRVVEAAVAARDLAARLTVLATEVGASGALDDDITVTTRRPLSLPGGLVGDSEAAAMHLLRSGATVLVDGYNVAMLGWPDRALADQRRALLDLAEDLARRTGADLAVMFDGGEVVGATAEGRRVVRVVFSPADVTADDVIRAEVARLPVERAVVIITNDVEIVRDVRAAGANTISSDQFLAVARR
ncbi:MAG: NYN domain-containing protein [Ilumatobacteraceae bacterium]